MNSKTELNPLYNSLDNFFKRYINTIEMQTGTLPVTEYHSDWPSPCQQGERFLSEEMVDSIHWKPVQREHNNDLAGLESALETELHPDIKIFFSYYWSNQMNVSFVPQKNPSTDNPLSSEEQGNLTLMFIWNEADMKRLIENQIGHTLNKLRNKQSLSLFFACTDSDFIISVENDSGHVVLERPGYPIEKVLSPSLKDFIDQLDYELLS